LRKLIAHLRARGTKRLVATVLRENTRMLELARELGFTRAAQQPEPDTWAIELPLQ
jgi:acetyltransferase